MGGCAGGVSFLFAASLLCPGTEVRGIPVSSAHALHTVTKRLGNVNLRTILNRLQTMLVCCESNPMALGNEWQY